MMDYTQEPSRSIVISTDIDNQLAGEVVAFIMEINQIDALRSQALKDYEPQPIEIFINSNGGSATDGFAIIGAMEMSETPIFTYAIGQVASMALAIFIAGDVRFSHRFTRFMYHSVSYGMTGHITDHEDMKTEADMLQRMYNSLIHDRTNITKEMVADIRAKKKDFYFSGRESVKLGVSNQVLDKPEKRYELVNVKEEESEEL